MSSFDQSCRLDVVEFGKLFAREARAILRGFSFREVPIPPELLSAIDRHFNLSAMQQDRFYAHSPRQDGDEAGVPMPDV